MAYEQEQKDYRGPGYISAGVGKAAVNGAVTGAVIGGVSAAAELTDATKKYALVGEGERFYQRAFNGLKDGFKNLRPAEGVEAVRANRYAAMAITGLAAIGAIVGMRNVARAKADQQIAVGQAHDAEREAQSLRRDNASLTEQTQVMANEMEAIATEMKKGAKSFADKVDRVSGSHADKVAEKHESHAEAVEASKEEAASLAV